MALVTLAWSSFKAVYEISVGVVPLKTRSGFARYCGAPGKLYPSSGRFVSNDPDVSCLTFTFWIKVTRSERWNVSRFSKRPERIPQIAF